MIEWIKLIKNHDIKEKYVLATILRVQGSAYRREGAKMLYAENGKEWGSISAGCLEEDLRSYVEEVFQNHTLKIVTYDMTGDDDLLWGIGSGCNGKIDILLEPFDIGQVLPFSQEPYLPKVEQILKGRTGLVSVKSLSGEIPSSAALFVPDEGTPFGTLGDINIDSTIVRMAKSFLENRKNPEVREEFNSILFFERFEPMDRLFLFGANIDAEPVAKLAVSLGFHVILIDPRPARCTVDYFPDVHEFIIAHPTESIEKVKIDKNDYVIVMTHNFTYDSELLPNLVKKDPYYLGVLGTKERTDRLFPGQEVPEKISSPIGLSIGSKGPEEIAVSIMGEVIQKRHQRERVVRV